MKRISTLLLVSLLYLTTTAQQVMVHGMASNHSKPLPNVLIDVFEAGVFYKKLTTGKSGHFRFFLTHNRTYLILFYCDGFEPKPYTIVNKLDENTQPIPVYVEFDSLAIAPDSILAHASLFTKLPPAVATQFYQDIYEHESDMRKKNEKDEARKAQDYLLQQALNEESRFKNFKSTTMPSSTPGVTTTTVVIGNDTYLMEVSPNADKRYYKNDKPISEITYLFETTRRYEGVLKNVKDVSRFRKYNPQEHSK